MPPDVSLGRQVALQEAFGKQQKVNALALPLPAESLDAAHGRVHITEDLRRLARPDSHCCAHDPARRMCRCPSSGKSGSSGGSTAANANPVFCATRHDAWLPTLWSSSNRSSGRRRGSRNAHSDTTSRARAAMPRPRAAAVIR